MLVFNTLPARQLISEVCKQHKLDNPRKEVMEINLDTLPSVQQIQSIKSIKAMNAWILNLRKDIDENPDLYYQSKGTTEAFLQLTKNMPVTYDGLVRYLGKETDKGIEYPELAILILEKLKN